MTAQTSLTAAATGLPACPPDSGVGPAGSEGAWPPQLRARVARPHQDALVVAVYGEVDAATLEHLREVLWSRLSAAVATLVIELTGVGFLGVAGLQLLHEARLSAQARGIALGLVLDGGEAARAVRVAGLGQELACFATAEHALYVLDGRA